MADKVFETTIVTDPVTGYFVNALEPKPNLQQELKYSAQVILDMTENAEDIQNCKVAIDQATKLAVSKGTFPAESAKSVLQPLRSGDAEIADPTKNRGNEYANKIFFNANSTKPPGVIRKNGTDIIDNDECYSGALYRFQINFYPTAKGSPRICAGLSNVMKVGEGQRMDGRQAPSTAFKDHIEGKPEGDVELDGGATFEDDDIPF